MTVRDHTEYADNVAPWLLGALPALEAEVFERHLAGCEVCQQEALRLKPAVGALGGAVPAVEPPPELKASLMATVRQEAKARRVTAERPVRRGLISLRPATALAMATMVLAVGVLTGVIATQVSDGGERTIAAAIDRTRIPAGEATLRIGDGTARVSMNDLPDPGRGKVWELWIQRDGQVRRGPLTSGGDAEIPGGVEGADAVLVTRERAGGVDAPTEAPVIKFELS